MILCKMTSKAWKILSISHPQKKYRFNLDMKKAMKSISLLLLLTCLVETAEENASKKKTF